MESIIIRGAREHNLKDIDLELPRGKVIVVTGVSGSGKSSLAFDTIYAEGQRRYIESISTYARQFLEKLGKPDLDEISGLSPTIAIKQKNTVTSARSTVGTATEIYDYLRLLFARVGKIICPECGIEVRSHTPTGVAGEVVKRYEGEVVCLFVSLGRFDVGEWEAKKGYFLSRGYTRLLVEGQPVRIDDFPDKKSEGSEIGLLLDRLKASRENRSRIAESVELAYREPSGRIEVQDVSGKRCFTFTYAPSCSSCGRSFELPTPILFSFNSPYGACPECRGFGDRMEFSEELIVPDPNRSLEDRAIDPWSRERFSYFQYELLEMCRERGIASNIPYAELSDDAKTHILQGDGEYTGVIPFLERMREKSYKKGHRFFTRKYMAFTTCRACRGGRLRQEAYHVRIAGHTISDLGRIVPDELLRILGKVPFSDRERHIARDIISELESRLRFMIDVGLGYLTLDRLTRTLSGGEAQRINLANSLGANLVDALYILDEPSIGLHAADNERLISVMKRLRDLGNTVIVVEHDPEIIMASDYLVDLGPGAGREGGRVVFSGSMEQACSAKIAGSKTFEYLFGKQAQALEKRERRASSGDIILTGVSEHNLKSIDVKFPLGCLVCVTGVSGSGKSTLVVDVLYGAVLRKARKHAALKSWKIDGHVDRILLVDQKPIGTTPRSNPITYIKGFSHIREVFAKQKHSLLRGYLPGRFSFNKSGGRCPRCQGMGYKRVEMHFMADVFVPCEECDGKRFNKETLEVRYKGKNISEVLDLTASEALLFFDELPQLGEKLWILTKVGLGYLKLGQPSNTLSGGEAQRMKIARELAESKGEKNVYILDEPTTGLHMYDVEKLMLVIEELVKAGHTVVVIEHNMEVIRQADHIIDLGPGGGDDGGKVIACGTIDRIVKSKKSKTGSYLKAYIEKYVRER